MIDEYYEYVAMIAIGIMAIVCWLIAWNFQENTRVRWSFFWYGLILMGFEVCIIASDKVIGG